MASRTRTSGSRIPSTGFPTGTSNSVVISGTFRSPKSAANYTAGSYTLTSGYGMFSDNRASITDETGSFGKVNSCTNSKRLVTSSSFQSARFRQRNPLSPFGTAETTLTSCVLPYYLDQAMSYPHLGIPDGSNVALARVPSVCEELMSGLNSLYELKDCQTFLKLIPVHLFWAAARGKRRESLRALYRWLDDVKSLARSPLGMLQAVAGADLMWKFGVKPLMADINQVHTTLTTINAKVQELLNKKFTVAGRHVERKSDNQVHVSGVSSDTLGFFNQNISTYRTTEKTWVYGTQKYIDRVRLPQIDVLKMRATAEQLGLSLDATDMWEAVPYSFVVDWFLPIQTFLEQFGQAKPDPSWLLTSGSWSSVKTVTNGYTRWDVSPISGANCVIEATSGASQAVPWNRTDYQRTSLTSLPSAFPSIYIPELRWPSFDQSITGIELLLQRVKRTLK